MAHTRDTDHSTIEMRKSEDRSSKNRAGDELEAVDAFPPGGEVRPAASETVPDETPESAEAGDQVAVLEQELTEQRDKYLRLAAEFDNFRKRSTRERAEASQRGQAALLRKLLDVMDDIERFGSVDPSTTDANSVVEGMDLVGRKLQKELTAAGLQPVNPQDQPFDPALHEAMATEPAGSPEDDGLVARVYQRGYVFHGELLRPARVVVWQWND